MRNALEFSAQLSTFVLKKGAIMRATEKIYYLLVNQFPNQKVTTQQIAQAANLSRGVVSAYLSQLLAQGKVVKTNSRPVFWEIKRPQSSFDQLIGHNGSLQTIIEHCYEALLYPPNGLPLLIKGAAGTGKKLLAEKIKETAEQYGLVKPTDPVITINAQDYQHDELAFAALFTSSQKAANLTPNLSTKQLFPTDRGILLVNEVQQLSAHNQQILVDLCQRALSQGPQQIRLLMTLTSPSPITWLEPHVALKVTLPPFHERPFNERLALVSHFFQLEAQKIKRPLRINASILAQLTALKVPSNITEIHNRITLLTAQAYARNLQQPELVLGTPSSRQLQIAPKADQPLAELMELTENFQQLRPYAHQLLADLLASLKQGQALSEQRFMVLKLLNLMPITENSQLLAAAAQNLAAQVQQILTQKYGVTLPKSSTYWQKCALGMIFCRSYGQDPLFKNAYDLKNNLQLQYPRSTYLFEQVLAAIDPDSKLNNCYFLLFFLLMEPLVKRLETIKYNCILLAHGQGIATSMQQMINTLCQNYIFEAFDMPLAISLTDISTLVKQYRQKQKAQEQGTIILFDMGSLSQIFTEIKRDDPSNLLVINNLNSAMALDIGIRVQRHEAFNAIAQASKQYGQTTDSQYYEGLADRAHIIVSCMSGVGLSNEIKHVLEQNLSPRLKVVALDYRQLQRLIKNQDQQFFAHTILILTTVDLATNLDLKMMNIYDIFDADSSTQLQKILQAAGEAPAKTQLLIDQLLHFFSVAGIKNRLHFLNPDVIIQAAQNVVSRYENYYQLQLSNKLKLNLDLHLSLMVERMMLQKNNKALIQVLAPSTPQQKEFWAISAEILKPLEEQFNITVSQHEIDLIYEIFKEQLPAA